MNEKTKESKFLDAINRYSEKQTAIINREVEEYKAQKIEQATESGLRDAYELIQREIAERKAAILVEYAQKHAEIRRGLFEVRNNIADEVFARAEEKLREYTSTEEYKASVLRSAREAAGIISGCACVVRMRAEDTALAEELRAILPCAEITAYEGICIGGIRIVCSEKGLELDSTLDTRLSDQRRWFAENSGLKVM